MHLTEAEEQLLEGLEILLNPEEIDQYREGMDFDTLYAEHFKGKHLQTLINAIRKKTEEQILEWRKVKAQIEADKQTMINQPEVDEVTGAKCFYVTKDQLPGWLEQMEARFPDSEWTMDIEKTKHGLLIEIEKEDIHECHYFVPGLRTIEKELPPQTEVEG